MSNIFLLLSYLLHSKNNFELYFRFFHFPAASPLFSCAKHQLVPIMRDIIFSIHRLTFQAIFYICSKNCYPELLSSGRSYINFSIILYSLISYCPGNGIYSSINEPSIFSINSGLSSPSTIPSKIMSTFSFFTS